MIRDSKAGHPVADKSVGDGLYVGAVQREGNQLVRRAVHYCEEVVVALLGPWEVAHQVQVDWGEPSGQDGHLLNGGPGLEDHLSPLAELAVSGPAGDVCRHACPHPPSRHKALGGPNAQVGQCVDCSESAYRNGGSNRRVLL